MISVFRYNKKWRIKIENETLEFENMKEFEKTLIEILKLKAKYEPY